MAWYQKRSANGRARRGTAVDPDVVLFVDTLNNYSTPDIAKAALQVFEAAGLSVAVPGVLEDGRPMISKGLVEEARDAARRVVETLSPYAEKGIPVVGLEPSSLLTLRDEYLYLLPDDPRVRILAGQALLFDEYVSRLASEERLNLAFTDDARLIFLHGHCHQKALVGTGVSKEILTLPPNYTVHEIDSGCCGMAGSFGYEAEHYEISMKMAERRLLPAVREMPVGAIVSAAGVSCRQQIEHGAKKRALHPAQVLRDALQVTATV